MNKLHAFTEKQKRLIWKARHSDLSLVEREDGAHCVADYIEWHAANRPANVRIPRIAATADRPSRPAHRAQPFALIAVGRLYD
jgi:hypothetical protein